MPNLLTTVTGNLFELSQLSGIRVLGVSIPSTIADADAGPAYGIEGTREVVGVTD